MRVCGSDYLRKDDILVLMFILEQLAGKLSFKQGCENFLCSGNLNLPKILQKFRLCILFLWAFSAWYGINRKLNKWNVKFNYNLFHSKRKCSSCITHPPLPNFFCNFSKSSCFEHWFTCAFWPFEVSQVAKTVCLFSIFVHAGTPCLPYSLFSLISWGGLRLGPSMIPSGYTWLRFCPFTKVPLIV